MIFTAVLGCVVAMGGCGDDNGGPGGGGGSGATGGTGGSGATGGTGGSGATGGTGGSGGTDPSGFACTEQGIRNAILAGGGPHFFACDGPTTVPTATEIFIDKDVILDGEGELTVDGQQDHRVFQVVAGVDAGLRGITVTRGASNEGGGILNHGTLTLMNSTVSDSEASAGTRGGGGIMNVGTLTLTNSTVSGNSSLAQRGGGIHNGGTLTVTNSTLSGNSTGATGGGIANDGTLTLTSSTLANNSAGVDGSAYINFATQTVRNTLLSGTCRYQSGTSTGLGGNLESPGTSCGVTSASPGELNLGALADNGGPTQTHALNPSSVAIDVIAAVNCVGPNDQPLTEDQRGQLRPAGATSQCDIGSFEVQ
jgi:hypothetical protein